MIQIQIATRLTDHGVSDIRWVLLDPGEMATPTDAPGILAEADRSATGPATEGASNGPAPVAAGSTPEALTAAAERPPRGRRWPVVLVLCAILAAAGWVASGSRERSAATPTGATSTGANK